MNVAPDPVNVAPDPVNVTADPVNVAADPVNVAPDPVNVAADPRVGRRAPENLRRAQRSRLFVVQGHRARAPLFPATDPNRDRQEAASRGHSERGAPASA